MGRQGVLQPDRRVRAGRRRRARERSGARRCKEFAQRWELQTLFNVCRTQYAVGARADRRVERGRDRAAGRPRSARPRSARRRCVAGTAQLGELRRRQGRLDEARTLFGQLESSWAARIGSVELALDEDDPATALALAERLERATEGGRLLDRIAVLSLLVRAAVAAGRVDAALAAWVELDALADSVGTRGARGCRPRTRAA